MDWHQRCALLCTFHLLSPWRYLQVRHSRVLSSALLLTVNSTTSLLATGVVGIVYVLYQRPCISKLTPVSYRMFLATIPAVLWIDKLGRKPVLISGAFLMATYALCASSTALPFF